MFVAQAIKGNFGFCIESVVGLFVDHLIVLFRKTDRTFVVCSEIARTKFIRITTDFPKTLAEKEKSKDSSTLAMPFMAYIEIEIIIEIIQPFSLEQG